MKTGTSGQHDQARPVSLGTGDQGEDWVPLGDFAPARSALAVTPHDVNALAAIPKALFVGTGGNITMRGVAGSADQLWKNVPSGSIIPFRAQYIRATGTSAADILALY